MTSIKFQCSGCGACCKRAGLMGMMPQREDGACIHLTSDNKCSIYDERPEICNVYKMFLRNGKKAGMTEVEYYKFGNNICNQWIKEDGIPDSYLIDIGKYDT